MMPGSPSTSHGFVVGQELPPFVRGGHVACFHFLSPVSAACISRSFRCLTIRRSVGSLLRGSWNERVVKKGRCFAGLPIQQSFWHSTGPESISKPAERPHARCGSGRGAVQAASPEAKRRPPTSKRAEEEAQGASRDPEVRPATFRKTKRGTQKQKPGDFLAKERAS